MSRSLRSRLLAVLFLVVAGGTPTRAAVSDTKKTIVATYSVLQALVSDLAGDGFEVKTAIPNGLDPHAWEPSAKDIEILTRADFIVANGLGLEGGMQKSLEQAKRAGARVFVAADHITVRKVGHGEEPPSGDHDHDHHLDDSHGHHHGAGTADPHLWTDPMAMKAVARALAARLKSDFGVDLSDRLADLEKRLDALDAEIKRSVAALPVDRRKLVTGHESLGYFAQRYHFKLVGAVVPGLSSEAESSASGIAALKKLIAKNRVKVLFTELGTPARVTEALAKEAGVRCVPLTTHSVPADGSYFTFIRDLANTIVKSLE